MKFVKHLGHGGGPRVELLGTVSATVSLDQCRETNAQPVVLGVLDDVRTVVGQG